MKKTDYKSMTLAELTRLAELSIVQSSLEAKSKAKNFSSRYSYWKETTGRLSGRFNNFN